MHLAKKSWRITGTGMKDKTPVMGILERGEVKTTVVPNRKKYALQAEVKKHVEAGSALYTDALLSYEGQPDNTPIRLSITLSSTSNGRVHTKGLENFLSQLKRGINGTYISIEPFHLHRYLDEQAFRYNNRKKVTNKGRFGLVLSQVAGRHLTYAELTGKMAESC